MCAIVHWWHTCRCHQCSSLAQITASAAWCAETIHRHVWIVSAAVDNRFRLSNVIHASLCTEVDRLMIEDLNQYAYSAFLRETCKFGEAVLDALKTAKSSINRARRKTIEQFSRAAPTLTPAPTFLPPPAAPAPPYQPGTRCAREERWWHLHACMLLAAAATGLNPGVRHGCCPGQHLPTA